MFGFSRRRMKLGRLKVQLSEANPGTRTPVRPPKRNGTEIGDAAGGSSGHSDEVDCQPSTEITSCGSSENWMVLSIAGDKPIPRSNHAAAVIGNKMIVVGGESGTGLLDDVQVLNFDRFSWTTASSKLYLSPSSLPLKIPACKGHSLVSWGKKALLIGGKTDPGSDRISVWAFDTETECWSLMEAKGDIPVARSGHSVVRASSVLILFGGEDAKRRKLNDLHMFDLKSLTWLPLHYTGTAPSPRFNHVAALYDDKILYIFGGSSKSRTLNDLYSLDFETMAWSRVKMRGFHPSPRAGCCGVLCGTKWYITGGGSRKKRHGETVIFDIVKNEWSVAITSPPSSITTNKGFSMVLVQHKEKDFLVAFGGSKKEPSNQVEVLIMEKNESALGRQSAPSKCSASVLLEKHSSSTRLAPQLNDCSQRLVDSVARQNLASAIEHGSGRRSLSESLVVDPNFPPTNTSLRKREMRGVEFKWLRKALYSQACITFMFWSSPIFVSAVTFATSILLGGQLTAGGVLSALATFRILQEPLRNFPDLVSTMAQTKVSLDRISAFLQDEELQEDATIVLPPGISNTAIEIMDGVFCWDSSLPRPTLSGIHVKVERGMTVAVCGMVGSGKSSFLSCILGEIPKLSGEVKMCGSVAYVSQSAWIQSGNIEENILFGTPMDKAKYKNVLHACSLKKDLELFSHGDQTIIGDRGINLSGGQKQRVQLARALYQDADIYLLDDPFSAVDAHTGSELFREYVLTALADKTVIFVTHQVEFLPAADMIMVLKEGHIIQAGKYDDLLQAGTDFKTLVSAHHEAIEAMDIPNHSEDSDENVPLDDTIMTSKTSISSANDIESLAKEVQEGSSDQKVIKEKKKAKRSRKKQLVQEEERVRGRVSMKVYLSYMAAAYKGVLIPLIIIAQTLFQFLQIASNWWMAWANPQTKGDQPKVTPTVLLLVYMALAFGSSWFIFVRAVLVATFGLAAAQKLFFNMLRSIFHSPMSFFDSTPAGRILNRVSIDQSVVDLDIPFRLGGFASSTIQLIGIVAVMTDVTWQVLLLVVPLAIICLWMQKYYMASSRELVRIVSIQKSPIIHLFGESIAGAATIRGFGQEKRFMKRNLYLLDCFARPFFCSLAAIEWLCLRMELLSTFVFAFCLVLLVSLPHGSIDPSMAGLAVTYGLNLNARLSRWILSFCKLENKIISIERIYQYSQIPSEAPAIVEDSRPPSSWPENGTIQLIDLKVRYKENLPVVLHGVSCTFPGGKKIGIVGRTGSGKSTLIQALFRLVEPEAGSILIDNINISSIGLHDLRSHLSIIPQDPTLFEGTIRGNLDPLDEHSDKEIWEALDKSQLGDIIRETERKLDMPVLENGDNWSVGQCQLVSLGRALLKQSKILVLDEATASVDTATDNLIQKIIRREFRDCTVCTIAHRIPTVIDSDLVLVLSDGRVAEFDSPSRLLEDKSSMFLKLVTEYSSRSSGIPDF